MKLFKRSISILLILIFGISNWAVFSADNGIEAVITDTAEYIYKTVKKPQVGSIGGEWAVIGLARSGFDVPEKYYQNYYKTVEEYVKACGGVLHTKKYTEYSRLTVALTSIGKDPRNVAGYDLLTPLGDYKKTIWQGLNGPIWALIALDSGNYEMPQNPDAEVQATREMYIERILDCQLSDGGWSLFGGTTAAQKSDGVSDPDITGMAIQALSKYQDDERVQKATQLALDCMSKRQDENGGFSSWDTENSESCVQIAVALCELGISLDDPRFVKNKKTVLDNLMTYYTKGSGFKHTYKGDGSNQMATEQGFYAVVAIDRAQKGKSSLYRMGDAIKISEPLETEGQTGLSDKNPDVCKIPLVSPGKTFVDISAHDNQPAIEALAARNIINGKTEDSFQPESTMTRAEFATIIARGLGLPQKDNTVFDDVTDGDWFKPYVNTAYSYGIIKGVSGNKFNPNGTITREEAAVMVARAAKLCGMDTQLEAFQARDILAEFFDYVTASDWAVSSLAFCYSEDILSRDVMEIKPKQTVTRAEIAQMLFNMLSISKLI